MKTFKEFVAEQAEMDNDDDDHDSNEMTQWITHHVENTDVPHDVLKNQFIDKYGADKVNHFDKVVARLVN